MKWFRSHEYSFTEYELAWMERAYPTLPIDSERDALIESLEKFLEIVLDKDSKV